MSNTEMNGKIKELRELKRMQDLQSPNGASFIVSATYDFDAIEASFRQKFEDAEIISLDDLLGLKL